MTIVIATTAIAISSLAIVLLCAGDPKRLRAVGQGKGSSSRLRLLLAAGACGPGLALAVAGDSAAVMLWLGGVALLGWLTACLSSKRI